MAVMFAEIQKSNQEKFWEEANEWHLVLPEAHILRKILAVWLFPHLPEWE